MKAYLSMEKFNKLRSGTIYLLRSKLRFIIPLLIFFFLKIISAFLLLQRIEEKDFLSLFHGWDSFYYMSIATRWYPNTVVELWAFFPFYPYISRIINIVLHDVWLSTTVVSFISGVVWIPIYQSIAERYINAKESFFSTCMFASFPQVFLFTSVAYSESLFLLTTLVTWLLYLRGKILSSCISASLATLTRPYGILIILPILSGLLKRNLWKKSLLVFFPILTLLGWVWYNFIKTGDYFAFITAQEQWIGQPWQPGNWFREFFLPLLNIKQPTHTMAPLAAYIFLIPFIVLTAYLIIMTFGIDWKLGVYGTAVFITALSIGTPLSAPRFIPFIFPLWLNIKTKKFIIAFTACVFFYLHAMVVWFLFTSNIWVG
ncbi:MAG: hypothetical protein NWE86_07100 [Candidatus Bathyarchaeota archaeon]|nr:hypothetical protein [Candidatus Bathyarchaeota archaeon]